MQKDFHYYCIAALAKGAGFSDTDAFTIAYASQYLDDATDSIPITIGNMVFDPVRTAHNGLQSFKWSVQKRIYLAFHFIPPKSIKYVTDSFVARSADPEKTPLIYELLEDIKNTYFFAKTDSDRVYNLCRLGIFLHTFADSWAHNGFSGRQENNNDVESIYLKVDGKWNHLFFENIFYDITPLIGHAQAGGFPDFPYQKWKYTNDATGEVVERDNVEEFLEAAHAIYEILHLFSGSTQDATIPEELSNTLKTLFEFESQDLNKRCDQWIDTFEKNGLFDSFQKYRSKAWREELNSATEDNFLQTKWVKFHRAALKQRHFVMERLF